MNSCSKTPPEYRRARPCLGTLVEIVVPHFPGVEATMERAFAAVFRVQALMSAHDESSDLGRLYAAEPGVPVLVNPWTWRVLAAAEKMYRLTKGVFDPVVAGRSALDRGGLPDWFGRDPVRAGTFSDVTLSRIHRVRLARPVRIDLGGIAKGFAVDQATRVLRRAGLPWGLVNAGGDLRVFGRRNWPVHLRHPGSPGRLLVHSIRDCAMATSAPYFSERVDQGRATSALLDAATGSFITGRRSISVLARTGMAADALTKVMLSDRATAALRAYRARAFILQESGWSSDAA